MTRNREAGWGWAIFSVLLQVGGMVLFAACLPWSLLLACFVILPWLERSSNSSK